jgi:hypothetical protein
MRAKSLQVGESVAVNPGAQQEEAKVVTLCKQLHQSSEKFRDKFFLYRVRKGECLAEIAAQYGLSVKTVKCLNPEIGDDEVIFPHQELRLLDVQRWVYIVVDTDEKTLTVYIDKVPLKEYWVTVGRGGIHATPVGDFRIRQILWNPYDYINGVPPGHPENQFGIVWMGLDIRECGIHGTNESGSIGRSISKGCIRMSNADASEVGNLVCAGVRVYIR